MRRRSSALPFLYIVGVLFVMVMLPKRFTEHWRERAVSWLAPSLGGSKTLTPKEELQWLRLENERLMAYREKVCDLLKDDNLPKYQPSRSAHVVARHISSWNSCLWIDIGEDDNKNGAMVVAKNSPVVSGSALIGVVDYIGKKQSRVCLITDSRLIPSVRAARGSPQSRLLLERFDSLIEQLQHTENGMYDQLIAQLKRERGNLLADQSNLLLAKGELCGTDSPLWRGVGKHLRGTGFNYDTADHYGPARDLRTGVPIGDGKQDKGLAIINEGDLLLTTGMDGIFPEGLPVALVTKVELLKEGAYYYDIEAKPIAQRLDELSVVYVLPPAAIDPVDQS